MGKKHIYCVYCDKYLSRNSLSSRQDHMRGVKHQINLRTYYTKHIDAFLKKKISYLSEDDSIDESELSNTVSDTNIKTINTTWKFEENRNPLAESLQPASSFKQEPVIEPSIKLPSFARDGMFSSRTSALESDVSSAPLDEINGNLSSMSSAKGSPSLLDKNISVFPPKIGSSVSSNLSLGAPVIGPPKVGSFSSIQQVQSIPMIGPPKVGSLSDGQQTQDIPVIGPPKVGSFSTIQQVQSIPMIGPPKVGSSSSVQQIQSIPMIGPPKVGSLSDGQQTQDIPVIGPPKVGSFSVIQQVQSIPMIGPPKVDSLSSNQSNKSVPVIGPSKTSSSTSD